MTGPAVVAALVLAACAPPAAPPPSAPATAHWVGSLSPPPAPGAEVVATVNGAAIYVADVELQARAAGQTPAQALDELVGAMLLAEVARGRGLADDPDVADARRRAEVRALLARAFEPSFAGPEAVPQEEVDALYRRDEIRGYYDHEEYHACAWIRVKLAATATPDEDERAHERALQIWAAVVAAQPRTKEAFYAAAKPFGAAASSPFSTTREHGPAAREFAAACFSVDRPGGIAAPARTEWGWDVLYLDDILAERHASRAEAEADIRRNRFEAARRSAFKRWVDQLAAGHRIVKNEQRLETVQVDSLVGLP
jgi:hypothetical protein